MSKISENELQGLQDSLAAFDAVIANHLRIVAEMRQKRQVVAASLRAAKIAVALAI